VDAAKEYERSYNASSRLLTLSHAKARHRLRTAVAEKCLANAIAGTLDRINGFNVTRALTKGKVNSKTF
jgi:hypothetical protein